MIMFSSVYNHLKNIVHVWLPKNVPQINTQGAVFCRVHHATTPCFYGSPVQTYQTLALDTIGLPTH